MRRREEIFAIYIIDNKCTIRQCAEKFNVGKSTVHSDISKKLIKTNKFLYYHVYKILNINLAERNIRGGNATRLKYLNTARCIKNKNA
jgi:putative DeoR family transcriptional regulator (stage III sporulation protein D)